MILKQIYQKIKKNPSKTKRKNKLFVLVLQKLNLTADNCGRSYENIIDQIKFKNIATLHEDIHR